MFAVIKSNDLSLPPLLLVFFFYLFLLPKTKKEKEGWRAGGKVARLCAARPPRALSHRRGLAGGASHFASKNEAHHGPRGGSEEENYFEI